MGNDGGVIAVQRKFMRHGKQKEQTEKAEKELLIAKKSSTCSLSDQPLEEPIVVDDLGNLYNKAAVIESLLSRTIPESFGHLEALADVTTCSFTMQDKKTICPITLVEFTGKQPFVVMRKCGCVVSEKAYREMKLKECLKCSKPFSSDKESENIIFLLPAAEKLDQLRKEMNERKALRQSSKKKKKSKRKLAAGTEKPESKSTTKRGKMAQEAADIIEQTKKKSSVYSSLFSKNDEKKSANDLLMTVGGMRYTLS